MDHDALHDESLDYTRFKSINLMIFLLVLRTIRRDQNKVFIIVIFIILTLEIIS